MDDFEWYKNVKYYLKNMEAPFHLTNDERRSMKLQAIRYIIVKGSLWWRKFEGILLKCIYLKELERVVTKMHSRVCGGHYIEKSIIHKVMKVGFWWPSLFKDAHVLVRKCDPCQRFVAKLKLLVNTPLKLVEVQAPFQ